MTQITDTAQTGTPKVLQRHHAQASVRSIAQSAVPKWTGIQCENISVESKCSTRNELEPLNDLLLCIYTELNPRWIDTRPRTVRFLHPDGTPEFCAFALTAHLRDHRRLAIAVEHDGFTEIEDRISYYKSIKALIPRWFADGIALFTQSGLARA